MKTKNNAVACTMCVSPQVSDWTCTSVLLSPSSQRVAACFGDGLDPGSLSGAVEMWNSDGQHLGSAGPVKSRGAPEVVGFVAGDEYVVVANRSNVRLHQPLPRTTQKQPASAASGGAGGWGGLWNVGAKNDLS